MTKKQFSELRIVALIGILCIAIAAAFSWSTSAEAGSYRAGGSFRPSTSFKPSTFRATPKVTEAKPTVRTVTPPPKQPQKVIVNRTTVNQTVVNRTINTAPSNPVSSSGGGFFSSFFGAAAGAGVTNYLMKPDEPAPQAQPVQEAVQQPAPAPQVPPQPNPQGCVWDAAGQFFKCPAVQQVAPQ